MSLNDKDATSFAEGLLVARDMNAAQIKAKQEMQALSKTLNSMSGELEMMRNRADQKMAHPGNTGFGDNPHSVNPNKPFGK